MLTNNIDPILIQTGPFTIRWYGLFLAIGVLLAVLIMQSLFKEKKYPLQELFDMVIWLVIGGLIGARLGHIIFYNLEYYVNNAKEIIMIHHGGLSSHGLTMGLLAATLLYYIFKLKPKYKDNAFETIKKYLDIIIIPIPLLAAFIRIGNFFNSEIIGTPTTLPWGVWFGRADAEMILRHPSQIYEALVALTIFFILYAVYKKNSLHVPLYTFHLFLLLYFSTRFLVEFVKERHTLDGLLSMGQWLSIPFVVWSIYWFVQHRTRNT